VTKKVRKVIELRPVRIEPEDGGDELLRVMAYPKFRLTHAEITFLFETGLLPFAAWDRIWYHVRIGGGP
jgi:hypothetical protein